MSLDPDSLVARAMAARERAHAPYSRYTVGAAVVTEDGTVFEGANVENASYGLTVCAERVALFSAAAAGHRKVIALAVVSGPGASMCGACRQVLREFAGDEVPVHLADAAGTRRDRTLGELLPESFGPEGLLGDPPA